MSGLFYKDISIRMRPGANENRKLLLRWDSSRIFHARIDVFGYSSTAVSLNSSTRVLARCLQRCGPALVKKHKNGFREFLIIMRTHEPRTEHTKHVDFFRFSTLFFLANRASGIRM